ncbi:hypothetical protein RFN29_24785 [Mesorhizobium sp. VK22B]|uniref:Uncharacterized protein n=1 Tax=Mesorhizobium captivum TaxID=3072319 RepID=A0ABU4Z6D2_9HYPH|nr:hypothetical protein [Mesorhizobium sp. VK22B]MDX8494786.1 hypothetical protein [Mesorhizobium sp. VK22B]
MIDHVAASGIISPAHPSPTFSFRKDGRVTSVRVDSQLAITINERATQAPSPD